VGKIGGERREWRRGEIAQTMHAHMNKGIKKERNRNTTRKIYGKINPFR
jgi:hypothetical protein